VYPARRRSPDSPPERPYDVTGWTLPLQMGTEVREIERTFLPPAMSRLSGAAVTPAAVWGERKPDFYVIDARGNGGALAANRLIAAGGAVSWMTHPFDLGGFRHAAGSLIVPYSSAVEPIVAKVAAELGLRADGMKGKPPADARAIGRARVALYKPWGENIDEGWTRWLLEQYEFRFTSISDADVRAGNLRLKYDAIVLPSAPADELIAGQPSGVVPPEYAGGLSEAGVDALKTFVQAGGTLICLDQAGSLAIEAFSLPIQDVARSLDSRFYCPGSILRVDLDPSQPLAFGMNPHAAGFFAFSSAYEPTASPWSTDGHSGDYPPGSIQTVARYGAKDLLLSGWLEGDDVIAGRSAVVRAAVGAGHIVLLGFPVQHRAQSYATFRLLFNAILTAR
jgi:hypothetical protein